MDKHLVRVHLPIRGEEDFDKWVDLEDYLDVQAKAAGVGSLDGNEVGGGEFTIWLAGTNGGRLADVIMRALWARELPPQCYLFVRHGNVGDEGAREEIIPLN